MAADDLASAGDDAAARFAGIPPPTPRRMARFLRAYARSGVVLAGCQAAGVARSTFYDWQAKFPAFAMAAGEAQEAAADRLEQIDKWVDMNYERLVEAKEKGIADEGPVKR